MVLAVLSNHNKVSIAIYYAVNNMLAFRADGLCLLNNWHLLDICHSPVVWYKMWSLSSLRRCCNSQCSACCGYANLLNFLNYGFFDMLMFVLICALPSVSAPA